MNLKIQLENSPRRIVRAPVRRDGTHAHWLPETTTENTFHRKKLHSA